VLARQEGTHQQVVDLVGNGLAPQLEPEVLDELLQILGVGAQRVWRGVAFPVEMPQERLDGGPHG
jgi:hypothetical protein